MLYNIKQRNELFHRTKELKAAGVRNVEGYLFDFVNNSLSIHYEFMGFPMAKVLDREALLTVIQFDDSVKSYNEEFIKDDVGRYTWEQYFDTLNYYIALDFLLYHLAIEDQKNIISIAA